MVIWALASGLLAFFPDDPGGTPTQAAGRIHLALAFVAFLAILIGAILLSGALRDRPVWGRVGAPMTILFCAAVIPLLLLGHSHFRANSLGGLYEKIFLAIQLLWVLVVVSPIAARNQPRAAREPTA